MKSIGGAAAFASATGVGSAENRQVPGGALPESPFDFEYRTVGDDVKDAVGHLWWLLTIDRDRIDELLAKSPASTNATRRKQEAVDDLRSAYQVELERDERDERELTYHLAEPTVRPLHETDIGQNTLKASSNGKEPVERVAESVSEGLRQEVGSRIEPAHSWDIHRNMAESAVRDTEYDDVDIIDDHLRPGSVDPDDWPQKCQVCSDDWLYLGDRFDFVDISPDVVEEEVREAIRAIDDRASPHHMYVPGREEFEVTGLLAGLLPPWVRLLKVEIEGAAPRDAQAHWENATSGYSTDFTQLGRAFHFLQDMSHPLHTGAIGPQVLDTRGPIHTAYMEFVDDNWDYGNDTATALSERFDEGTSNPLWDGSMEGSCERVAINTTNYSEHVYDTIVNNGPNNRDDWDDIVENSAGAGLWFAGAYSRGAINQL